MKRLSSAGTVLQPTHFTLPTRGRSQPRRRDAKAALSLQTPENSPSPPPFLARGMGTAWESCHHPAANAGGTTTLSIIAIRDHHRSSPSSACLGRRDERAAPRLHPAGPSRSRQRRRVKDPGHPRVSGVPGQVAFQLPLSKHRNDMRNDRHLKIAKCCDGLLRVTT